MYFGIGEWKRTYVRFPHCVQGAKDHPEKWKCGHQAGDKKHYPFDDVGDILAGSFLFMSPWIHFPCHA